MQRRRQPTEASPASAGDAAPGSNGTSSNGSGRHRESAVKERKGTCCGFLSSPGAAFCLGSPWLFLFSLVLLLGVAAGWYKGSLTDVSTAGYLRSTSSAPPKVLFTIFAGRKYHLLFQEPYWLEMYKLGAIDEIHLWDYIPRQEPNGFGTRVYDLNRGYLDSLVKKYSFIKIMDPGDVIMKETYWYDKDNLEKDNNVVEWHDDGSAALRFPEKRSFSEYYKYYTDNPWDGVILKADDDILYINSTQVSAFAQYSWDHPEVFFLSASVVNQGLCGHYQQKYGNAIPRELLDLATLPTDGFGESHRTPNHALLVHKHFLASEENRRRFYITEPEYVEYDYSININFFAIRGDQWHETYEVIVEKLKREEKYLDEEAVTKDIMQWRGKKEGIYLPLVVAHATYSHQKSVQQEVLTDWANWAKKERSELYGNLLDSWKPPAKPFVKGKLSSLKNGQQ